MTKETNTISQDVASIGAYKSSQTVEDFKIALLVVSLGLNLAVMTTWLLAAASAGTL